MLRLKIDPCLLRRLAVLPISTYILELRLPYFCGTYALTIFFFVQVTNSPCSCRYSKMGMPFEQILLAFKPNLNEITKQVDTEPLTLQMKFSNLRYPHSKLLEPILKGKFRNSGNNIYINRPMCGFWAKFLGIVQFSFT